MDIKKVQQILEKEYNARKVYEEALDAIKEVVGLEQYANELTSAAEKAKKELESLTLKVSEVKKETVDILEAANKKADAIIEEAIKESNEILDTTDLEAKATLDKVNTSKEDVISSMNAILEQRDVARKELREASAELSAVNLELNRVRETLKGMLK